VARPFDLDIVVWITCWFPSDEEDVSALVGFTKKAVADVSSNRNSPPR
jgi:hypothetical protein